MSIIERRGRTALVFATLALAIVTAAPTLAAENGPEAASPGTALEALLTHVPESHRDACVGDMSDADPAAVMRVRCELDSGLTVYYTQFGSPEAMAAHYQSRLEVHEIKPDSGSCSQAVPSETSYTIGGVPAGRLVCYESFGYDTFEWTHDDTDIFGLALLEDDLAGLWGWWSSDSGPITPDPDAPPTGQGAALDDLLSHVPVAHRDTCLPFAGGTRAEGILASVSCDVEDDLSAYYRQFDSLERLTAWYEDARMNEGVDENSGDCSVSVPAEQGYTIGGDHAGRLLCTSFLDSLEFVWTHEPTAIEATVFSDRDLAGLWQWWVKESGPVS